MGVTNGIRKTIKVLRTGRRTFQSYGKEEAIQSKAWGTEATVGMRRDTKT